jgi:hypothetical protein
MSMSLYTVEFFGVSDFSLSDSDGSVLADGGATQPQVHRSQIGHTSKPCGHSTPTAHVAETRRRQSFLWFAQKPHFPSMRAS